METHILSESLEALRESNQSLLHIIRSAGQERDLWSFITQLLRDALRPAGSTAGVLALIEGDSGCETVHHILALKRNHPKSDPDSKKFPLTPAMRALVSRIEASTDGDVVTLDGEMVDRGLHSMMVMIGMQSGQAMALRVAGRTIGWVYFGYPQGQPLKHDRLPVLKLIADQMTIAVELLRKSEKAKRFGLAQETENAEQAESDRLAKANQALKNTIRGLSSTNDLPSFLETVLSEALRATGSFNGSVVLIEGHPGSEVGHHIVMLAKGEIVDVATKRSRGIEKSPFDEALRAHAARIEASDDGAFCTPQDPLFRPEFRQYLVELRIQSIHTMALRVGGRMIGWVAAGYTEGDPRDPERLALLRLLADHMTIAVELTRMAEQAKKTAVAQEKAIAEEARGDRLAMANSALHNMVSGLTLAEDLPSFLETVLVESLRAAGTGHGAVVLIEKEAGVDVANLVVVLERGEVVPFSARHERGIARVTFDDALRDYVSRVAVEPNGASCNSDYWPFPEPFAQDLLVRQGVQSVDTLPLLVGGRMIGCLGVGYLDRLPRSMDHKALLRLLAGQMTIAVELTRMAEQAKQAAVAQDKAQIAQLRADQMAEANRVLKRSLDLISEETNVDNTLSRMLEVMSEQIDCSEAALCMRSDESDVFEQKIALFNGEATTVGSSGGRLLLCPPASSEFWREVAQRRRSSCFQVSTPTDYRSDPMQQWFEISGAKSVLGVPLLQRGEVIGCFVFRFPDRISFSPEQLEFLQTLAHQATLAVQLERLSIAAQVKSQHTATLAERARIARDLHDTLAQGFTGILMHLQASQRTSDADNARGHVNQALDAARVALVDARRSVHALRSIASERADFALALRGVLKTTFAGSSVVTEVYGDGSFGLIPESVENELLRIAQEAATNALKHSQATRFIVRIIQAEGSLKLQLQDNGVGFDTEIAGDGFGLLGIYERATRAGAEIFVDSRPGAGTCITVSLPYADMP